MSKPRGFAALTPERQREIASSGGRAAHAAGNAHEWTSKEAREAGRKGGMAAQARKRRGKVLEGTREVARAVFLDTPAKEEAPA